MYMLILNFTYPLRCLRVPPVEYHWASETDCPGWRQHGHPKRWCPTT